LQNQINIDKLVVVKLFNTHVNAKRLSTISWSATLKLKFKHKIKIKVTVNIQNIKIFKLTQCCKVRVKLKLKYLSECLNVKSLSKLIVKI
jgi:hypothetical protein